MKKNNCKVSNNERKSLQQINTFVIDFDRLTGEKLDSQMILGCSNRSELMLSTPFLF